jgi:hypothetical protein
VKAEGVAMLESTLHGLTPKDVSTFPKLSQGDPYHFDRWENGCPYYWFEGVKNIRNVFPYLKFVLVSVNRYIGWLSREMFREICPTAKSDGECGIAVLGRIFEALGIAVYSSSAGFKLTDADEATRLLEAKPAEAYFGWKVRLEGSPREGPESTTKPPFHCEREIGFTARSRY